MTKQEKTNQPNSCDPTSGCCSPVNRRTFIQLSGLSAAGLAAAACAPRAIAGPFQPVLASDHYVPVDKKLSAEWLKTLFAKGERTWYAGKDLETIAMPVGGICAGQLYLAGDGTLTHWDIFNQHNFTGYGRDNYQLGRKPQSPLAQGFAIQVDVGGNSTRRPLSIEGFPSLRFSGEYPIGAVDYRDEDFPVDVRLEAFSPFIPLNEDDSALPATLMEFTLTNRSQQSVDATLAGWLENATCLHSSLGLYGARINRVIKSPGMSMIDGTAVAIESPQESREPRVLADFEGGSYGEWTAEGEAFGDKPSTGTIERQQEVSGFAGKGLVNTFLQGSDQAHGKLTSPAFVIDRRYLSFLIGGGDHPDKTCINLIVDGKVVRTAVGKRAELLQWHNWSVQEFEGKEATIEIIDAESGPWGHINIDQIELRDQPVTAIHGDLTVQSDFGSMGIAVLGGPEDTIAHAAVDGDDFLQGVLKAATGTSESAQQPFGEPLIGAVGKRVSLGPSQSETITFVIAWNFPNREERGQRKGNYYANRFDSASDVTTYVADNYERLAGDTRRWHATWYDSTLPHWLLDRLMSTTSTLATSTCQWWADGRFWAWEGVGCCHGTCAHVWNYEHSMARLFPKLERSVREMQDFNPEAGFDAATGQVRFRGEGWGAWAGDSQGGTVLKALREHQVSKDSKFLKTNWPRIKKCLQFLIEEDADANGLLEGSQHNTYDINFVGPNTMVGSLYLAALLAGEEMASELGDAEFAKQCRTLFESGRQLTLDRLFNGEYFVQEVDLEKNPKFQYADGCLADQLFGQGWAHQVGLGYVYPREAVLKTLESIWRYNWTPDVGPQNAAHAPERWFAYPGEAGLFTCTWPKSPHLAAGVRYKNEVWTGIEYQVAGNMAWDGLVTEALAICRAIHERYHPSKHNPWNEIECGDHYARGMASHGVFLGLAGFEYHGPNGFLGFAPRISPEDYRSAFTAAEGWGTLSQQREDARQTNRVAVRWGNVELKTVAFEVPENATVKSAAVTLGSEQRSARFAQDGQRVTLALSEATHVGESETIEAVLQW